MTREQNFSYADAATVITGMGETDSLLQNEVKFLGTYANAVEVPNGVSEPPPAYEQIQSMIVPLPLSPPSPTLISVYSLPIRVEYEENDRIQIAGCKDILCNYYVFCRMCCAFIGLCCCLIPFMILIIIIFN